MGLNALGSARFRSLYTARAFGEMGEKFEAREAKRIGQGGFERVVTRVGDIEKTLGIEDMGVFTPRT